MFLIISLSYILQKILTSYDVEADYQTIDNNKLNNDILSKYRFLK
jgi:hypothetical protein